MALFSEIHDRRAEAYVRTKISLTIQRAASEIFDDCRNPNTSYHRVTRTLSVMNASRRPYVSVHSFVSSLSNVLQFSSVLAFTGALLCSLVSAETAFAAGAVSVARGDSAREGKQNPISLPLMFEENRGQASASIRFLAHGPEGIVAFTRDEVILPCGVGVNGLSMTILGEDRMQVRAEEPSGGVVNYYSGEDRNGWIERVPLQRQVRYSGAASGVDLIFHGNDGRLEYDMEVSPGADPGAVAVRAGAESKFAIQPDGSVAVENIGRGACAGERVRLLAPEAYQVIHGVRSPVHAEFRVDASGSLRFAVKDYDARFALTIDPVVGYTKIIAVNNYTTVAGVQVDAAGDVFVAGTTSATNYPATGGQGGSAGSGGVYVTKLDPTGTQILYSTYLSAPASASAFALDQSGNGYIAGVTTSSSFPVTSQNLGTCSTFCNAGFVAKFDGTGAMVYSTLIGSGQQLPKGIVADAEGNLYIAGLSADAGLKTVNAFQSGYSSGLCTSCTGAFFAKLNPAGTAFVFSSYFYGPSASDLETWASAIALDAQGNIYLAGPGDGVPLVNSFQQGIGGSFAAEFAPDGKTLLFSTLLGGTLFGTTDQPPGMQVAPDGTMFLAGVADAQDFPFSPNAVTHPTYPGSNLYLYAAAIGPSRSGFQFSTVLGTGFLTSTAVDANGRFYVAGNFTQGSIPFVNPVATESPVGAYIMELDSTGALINSTAFGGHDVSQVASGMAVDAGGNVYIAGIPTTVQFGASYDPLNVGTGTAYTDQGKLTSNTSSSGYSTFIAKILPASQPQISLSYYLPVLTLANAGSADLHISGIQLSGGFAKANSTCGATVPGGSSCYLTPSDTNGNYANGTITIQSDAQPSSQSFTPAALSLPNTPTSIGPQTIVDTSQLVFPPVQNGNTSAPRPIRVWNVGTTAATVSSVLTFTGVSQTNDCSTIAPQTFCTINVSVSPPSNGGGITNDIGILIGNSRTDVYPVFTQNQVSGPLLLSANGYGLGYGNVLIDQTSVTRTVTVTNSGNAATAVGDPSITGIGSSDFSVASNSCSGVTLQPQQSCVIAVVFQPVSPGRDAVPMAISGGGTTNTIYLVGTGIVAPTVSITPGSANLGNIQVGSSATQIFQVSNTSSAPVSVTNIVTTLANATFSTEFSESDTCQSPLAVGGSCSITLTYSPQVGGPHNAVLTLYLNGNGPTQQVAIAASAWQPPIPAALTLTASPSSSSYGQQVVLMATLSPSTAQGQSTDGETITFRNSSSSLGTATLKSGLAILNITSLPVGTADLTASYAGDTGLSAATSNVLTYPVSVAAPLVSWATPARIVYGNALTASQLNATAPVPGTFSYTPALGTILPAGVQTLSVTFTPTDTVNYTASSATVSLTVNQTPLTITANNASRMYGEANPPFGATLAGAVNGDSFTESFSTTATAASPIGVYSIVPAVTGVNLANYAVNPVSGTLTILQAGTATALSLSNSNLTLNATVTSLTTGTPTGSVGFYAGRSLLGTGSLNNGFATFTIPAWPSADASITAQYSGDANFAESSSQATQGLTIAPSQTVLTVDSAGTVTDVLNFSAASGFSGTVQLSCTGLPQGATCSFQPPSITFGGSGTSGSVTMTVQTVAATASGALPRQQPGNRMTALTALLVIPGLLGGTLLRRKSIPRRNWQVLSVFLLGVMCAAMGACGSAPKASTTQTPPAISTIRVVASGASGFSQSTSITLTVR